MQNVAVRIENEWNKLKIENHPTVGPFFDVGQMGSLDARVGYVYSVNPAYIQDQHQRIDGYSVRFGGELGSQLGAGRSAEAQISFSRLYANKTQALLAIPRGPSRFPYSSENALRYLSVGSAARFEIASDGHIGAQFAKIVTTGIIPLSGEFSASLRRGKRYIVDVYRVDSSRVRVRLIATRNMGSFGIHSGLGPLTSFNFGMGFADHALKSLFRCELISVDKEASLNPTLPVDTMMTDYVIDLQKETGSRVYDRFFQKILAMDVLEQLSLFQTNQDFYDSVWSFSQVIDQLYQDEKKYVSDADHSVFRYFKGRTLTDFRSITLSSECFKLWDVKKEIYHGTSSLRTFNDDDITSDYLYLSTQRLNKRNFIFNFLDEEHSLGVNSIFYGVRAEPENPLSLQPLFLSDLVLVRSFKDKVFSGKDHFLFNEIKIFIADLNYQYPNFFSQIDWRDYQKTKKMSYSQMEIIFDGRSIELLRQLNLDELQLKQKMNSYIQNYVKAVSKFALSTTGGGSADDPHRFDMDIKNISRRLAIIFQSKNNAEVAVKAFSSLRKNRLFQDIGAGFILSLLPRDKIKDLVEAKLVVGAKNTATIEVGNQSKGLSPVYKEVENIMSVINDRSFDLRLQKEIGVTEKQ